MTDQPRSDSTTSLAKKIGFPALAVAAPFLVLLLIELGFRLFSTETRDPYINITPFWLFKQTTINGTDSFVISNRFGYNQRTAFPVKKPDGGIRIFLLGGSACAGWPHTQTETFGSYLQKALQIAYPGRSVEVINAAAHGFASYRVRRIFDEIIKLEPSAIIIYSGNNEFLESREYDTGGAALIDALSERSRLFNWLRSVVKPTRTNLSGNKLRDVAGFFWSKVKQEALKLRSDPQLFSRVQEHYASSIRYMTTEASRQNVPVVLSTVPSNLRDWVPTVSHNRLRGDRFAEWARLTDRAQRHLLEGDPQAGISALKQAIEMESELAESYFWLGRLYEAAGQDNEALESYRSAKDLDYNPFRALSSFNKVVRQIAAQTERVFLLDLERIFERKSEHAAPGFDLFLDYVHPTKRANLIIAKNVLDLLIAHELFGSRSDDMEPTPATTWGVRSYDEHTDTPLQRRLFGLYALNHQYAAALQQTLHLHGLITGGPDAENCEELSPELPEKIREGCRVFRQYLTMRRLQILGQPVNAEKVSAKLRSFYDEWYPYGVF